MVTLHFILLFLLFMVVFFLVGAAEQVLEGSSVSVFKMVVFNMISWPNAKPNAIFVPCQWFNTGAIQLCFQQLSFQMYNLTGSLQNLLFLKKKFFHSSVSSKVLIKPTKPDFKTWWNKSYPTPRQGLHFLCCWWWLFYLFLFWPLCTNFGSI